MKGSEAMHMKRLMAAGLILALVAAGDACRRKDSVGDVRTVTISVPAMHNAAAASRVLRALVESQRLAPDKIQTDFTNQTVTVTYDSLQRAVKNLEFAIAGAGFNANETPADPAAAAKLPPDCR
jgi:hypothetical protein